MLSLPKEDPTDTIQLADWLEIYALISGDRNSSRGDLESALRTASLFEPEGDEAVQRKILEVFQELEDRSRSAREAYPFDLDGGVLRVRGEWEKFPAYVFCLCLSYFGVKQTKGSKVFPRRWFEHISRDALTHYLGGESLRFGSPRLKSEIPVGFKDAIDRVCTRMKEGECYKEDGGLPDRKDDAVDVIAWKHFPDQLPGKLIVFGNCATEKDWEGAKRTELSPSAFCSDWMMDMPKCEIVKSLFIPHRVEHKRFLSHLKRAGIIFDRCRVSYWAYFSGPIAKQRREKRFFDYQVLTQWSQDQLKAVRS